MTQKRVGGLVEQLIIATRVHRLGRFCPARAGEAPRLDDETSGLSLQFDFLGQLRLLEQGPGDADAPRVADSNDSGLRCHVTTS